MKTKEPQHTKLNNMQAKPSNNNIELTTRPKNGSVKKISNCSDDLFCTFVGGIHGALKTKTALLYRKVFGLLVDFFGKNDFAAVKRQQKKEMGGKMQAKGKERTGM